MSAERRRQLALLAIAGCVGFVVLVALLHALEPESNDTDAISEYALGDDYGWLMNVAFISAGVGVAALAAALRGGLVRSRAATTAVILFAVSALGWILLGAGNIDPQGADLTWHGVVHGVGFVLTTPSLILALFFLARAFRNDARWASWRRPVLGLAVAALLAFALAFAGVASPVTFRLFLVLALAGVVAVALRLRALDA